MAAHFHYPADRISPDSEDAFTEEEIAEIVELVRESSFLDDESGQSIDERMTAVFGGTAPDWSGFQTYDGICCVNCGGVLQDGGEQLGVVIQFEIAEDLESFVFSGMLVNGVEQPEGLIMQFEEQFSSELWEDDEEDWEDEADGGISMADADPLALFLRGGYDDTLLPEVFWGENPDLDRALDSLWEDGDDDDAGCEDNDCGCGHHHSHHHHDRCDCGDGDGGCDEDEDDYAGWSEEDAAERFWAGDDSDDWEE